MTVKDKVVVITGASSGIGAATVQVLAEAGAKLVIGARRTERLAELAASFTDGQGAVSTNRCDRPAASESAD